MLTANSNGSKQDFFCKSALPITAATRYILTFDYFLSETGSIRVWSDNNFGCSFTPDHTVRGSWKTASYIFTTSPDLTLNTGWDLAFVAEAGTAVIDNVTLRMYSTGVSAESITLNPGTLTLASESSQTLAIVATPADSDLNRTVWSSSNTAVATVNNGKVTAVAPGTAVITAVTRNGKRASCTVIVVKKTSISLNIGEVTLAKGGTQQLQATAFKNGAATAAVTWATSDSSVVTVANGLLTAVSEGTATVTASVTDRVCAYCVVTVKGSDVNQPVSSAVTVDSTIAHGTVTTSAATAASGDTVVVTVAPHAGYQPVPGSLKYITADGSAYAILNKDQGSFGEGDGTSFSFVMPVGAVIVTAEFAASGSQNFRTATVGTSLYYAAGSTEATGVRFLTRLQFDNLDLSNGTLTVTYNGTAYPVREFGTLLKRSLNATALLLENYDETDTSGATRLWKAVAYDGDTMKLVDYTESYLDFTVIMKTAVASQTFYDRYYDARAYLVLDNGTADGLVLYTAAFTDSANDAEYRLNHIGSVPANRQTAVNVTAPADNLSLDPVTDEVRTYLTLAEDDAAAAAFWSTSHNNNDKQNPVTLQWDEDGSERYRVLWSTDSAFAKDVHTAVVTECAYRLTLLVPGNTYYWKVRNARGAESAVRSIAVQEGVRWIDADGGRNIRDIGGWTVADGKTVKYEKLYRGACIDGYNGIKLTEEGVRVFAETLGIVTEIDLRGSDDGENGAQADSDFGGVYVKVAIEQYDSIFASSSTKAVLGQIMDIVSNEANYPIYFHCNAGADRTGTLAFLLNGLLGVSYEDLTRDFEMTGFGSTGQRLRSKLDTATNTFDSTGIMQNGNGNYIAWGPLYSRMMNEYGTASGTLPDAIANFLKTECGVTDSEIAAFRTLMLE